MDDWKPEDQALLEFDLNECTAREFCEVFSMSASEAKGVQEYRTEMIHVFKFEQLLKLKGVSKDLLEHWKNPVAAQEFDVELQKSLGMNATAKEPLPKILDTLCKFTSAEGCLILSRTGTLLLKAGENLSLFESLIPGIMDFVRPIRENLVQMDAGAAEVQVLGFELKELILLPTSGLFMVAIRPKGSLRNKDLNLWKSFAQEVRRRCPPKLLINNHAKVLENDIAFDCPQCHLRIVVDRAGAGYNMPCPRCKTDVTVPEETTSHSSYKEEAS